MKLSSVMVAGLTLFSSAALVHAEAPVKRPLASGDLLLPYYEVDTTNPSGLTTLWAVRNDSLQSIEFEALYYEPDAPQAFQRRDVFTLAAKAIKTVDIRFVQNLEVGEDGLARGFVIFRGLDGADNLQGDTFVITPDQNFASGQRLLNIDPESSQQELCSTSTIRFLRGGGFSGGTTFRIWFEADAPPSGANPVISYAVYSEAGGSPILEEDLPTVESAFEVDIATLLGPIQGQVNFGAIEFSFSGQVGTPPRNRLGHVSATLDALGAYSVGLEATCND